MSTKLKVNPETCRRCGLCASICPTGTIKQEEKELPAINSAGVSTCIECGHCMSVCPNKSINLGELSYDRDFFDLSKERIDFVSFLDFISSRRSIRFFQEKPVPRELLEKIIEAIAQAPMGFPPHKTVVTVLENRLIIEKMLPAMIKFYEDMLKGLRNPLYRFIIRRSAGVEDYSTIMNHLAPILKKRLPMMKDTGIDQITWGAQSMILLHASITAENHTQDADIALAYGLLAAHSLGLGATAISLVPPSINRTPELRSLIRLPDDHEITVCIILGYPRYRFQRGIKRALADVKWFG